MATGTLDPTYSTYSIRDVAGRTGLSQHTLRWYERIGLLLEVDRDHVGQRRYTERDLGLLGLITKLRTTGMPVADMVRYAELARAGDHTKPERQQLLETHRDHVRARMAELTDCLSVLDRKIDYYSGADAAPKSR
jgi:DNA-binding transcriptional MerR regulator